MKGLTSYYLISGTFVLICIMYYSTETSADTTIPPRLVDHCMECVSSRFAYSCNHTATCDIDEVCFVQNLEIRHILSFLPSTYFHGGCINKAECNTVATTSVLDEHHLAYVVQGECCYSNDCNRQIMQNYIDTTNQPKLVDYCMECVSSRFDYSCNHTATCGTDEVCFVQNLEIRHILPLLPSMYFHGGCINKAACNTVATTSVINEHGLAEVVQGECCYTNDCNRKIMQNYKAVTKPQPTTTIAEATTTTPQPTTTIGTTLTQQIVNHCMACKLNNTDWDCSHQDSCGLGEVCFVQELQLNFLDHKTYYHGGCIKQTECTKAAHTSMVDEHGLADVVHGECCNTDDCNRQILQNYKAPKTTPKPTPVMTTKETTIPPRPVDHCMECVNEGLSWICNHTATCRTDEVCFIQDLKLTVDIPSLPTTYFHGGCINKAECSKVAHTSVVDEHGLADVVQGECCYTNDCNSQILQKYQGVNSHKTVPPTTQPPQPVSTHTAKPPTTQPPPPQKCEVCKGGVCGLIANNDPVVQCTDAAPFCMNTVENDEHGAQTITKSCASGTECNSKWWHESAKKSVCVSYNHQLRYEFPFTCDFCCIDDRCNKEIRPDQTLMFIGTD